VLALAIDQTKDKLDARLYPARQSGLRRAVHDLRGRVTLMAADTSVIGEAARLAGRRASARICRFRLNCLSAMFGNPVMSVR
jgi:hypothetical protein